jgi:CHAD domain-containing protein
VHCLRLLGKPEFEGIIQSRIGVRRLRGFEMLFSKALARASSLIAVDVEKIVTKQGKS